MRRIHIGKLRFILAAVGVIAFAMITWSCNNPAKDEVTILQVHLDDSLSIQAGLYDSIRIDLADKDSHIWRQRIFGGPYDKQKDKRQLENLEIPEPAPIPLKIIISVFKGNQKQGEFLFQISEGNVAQTQPSTFVPPGHKSDSISTPRDTGKPVPGRLRFTSHELELFAGGDSAGIGLVVMPSDSGRQVTLISGNEDIFEVSGGRHLHPKAPGQADLIGFYTGFPGSADTAVVHVTKDPPVLDVGPDRKVPLDSVVEFPLHVTQKYGVVTALKWDLDGDGIYDDSIAKADTVLKHSYRAKGEFTLRFYARDSEGNEALKTIRIRVDIFSPLVVITRPSKDTIVNTPSFTLEYFLDGLKKTKVASLKEGLNKILVQESNSYGTCSDTVKIILDTVAPGKPVFSADLPGYIANRRPTWSWSQNSEAKGIGIFRIRLDGGDSLIKATNSFKPDVDLTDGAHALEIQEQDEAGNWSQVASQTIYVDLTKPVVKIENPSSVDGFVTAASSIVISGTAIDVGGVSNVNYIVSGRTAPAEGAEKWKTGSISLLPDSSTTIIVTAVDKAGNMESDTLRVRRDTQGPAITILSPSETGNLFTTISKQIVKGSALDASNVKRVVYQFSGATNFEGEATGTSDWILPEISLLPGISRLKVTAYDSLMNSSSVQLVFNYKPDVILVDAAAKGANTGATWKDAYPDLQTALLKSSTGEIWVAGGTYKPTTGRDRTAVFQLRDGLHIYGGFKGFETSREERSISDNNTILSGEIGDAIASDNVYHVVIGANNTSLDGITISGGYADGFFGEDSSRGGAVFANGTSPNIINCIVKNNYALDGAAIYLNNSGFRLVNCIFLDNKARDNGGSICIKGTSSPLIVNSLFVRNQAFQGGAVFSETEVLNMKNVLFYKNNSPYGNNVTATGMVNIYGSNSDTTFEGGLEPLNGAGAFYMYGKKGYWSPQFQDENNFRLTPGSPGIDEGVSDQDIPRFDITGADRPKGKQMDIGPYEQ